MLEGLKKDLTELLMNKLSLADLMLVMKAVDDQELRLQVLPKDRKDAAKQKPRNCFFT